MNTNYCYICGQKTSINKNDYPVCLEHGTLWPLRRNSICAEAFVVRDDGKILLIKRATEPLIGQWALPGGFTKYGEHPAQTSQREALEETGWSIELTGSILGVYVDDFPGDANSEHRVVVSYLAKPIRKIDEVDEETLGCDWFDINDLPKDLIKVQLNRFVDYRKLLTIV